MNNNLEKIKVCERVECERQRKCKRRERERERERERQRKREKERESSLLTRTSAALPRTKGQAPNATAPAFIKIYKHWTHTQTWAQTNLQMRSD